MKRGFAIRRAGRWDRETAVDRVVLDAAERHRRRIVLRGERGTDFLLDLDEVVMLRDGDGIVLDDGGIILITGEPEPLAEVRAGTPLGLVRLAWHLGNRHADVQIVGDRMRIRRDHVLEDMIAGLGGKVTAIAAPFDPEVGAQQHHGNPSHD